MDMGILDTDITLYDHLGVPVNCASLFIDGGKLVITL